jgi:hypothetical protein
MDEEQREPLGRAVSVVGRRKVMEVDGTSVHPRELGLAAVVFHPG